MPKFFLAAICLLCFMCGETQAKYCLHHTTALADREQARRQLSDLQASAPTAGEVRIMKMQINTGKVEQKTLLASRPLSAEAVKRVACIVQQVRLNPNYVRRTGGYKRVGKRTIHSHPELFLSFNGEWRELNVRAITSGGEMSKRWQLEENLLEELLSIVERHAPKQPD